MGARQCYHCKEMVAVGEPHDCWTTTEAALTADLTDDLREAWERLRESAGGLGEARIYASHSSIMFSRRCCYVFVRPKRRYLEVCLFLEREVRAPQIHKVQPSSRTKFAHLLRITHRDQVEAPITDWIAEAYRLAGWPPARTLTPTPTATPRPATAARRTSVAGGVARRDKPRARRTGKG